MDTREALLNTAEQAVRRWGYNGFSYGDLSTKVGIRKASIHYHFPKKEDLALALIVRYRKAVFIMLEAIATQHKPAGQQLTEFINIYRQALGGCDTLCLCVALSSGPDSLNKDILSEITKFQTEAKAWLTSVFELGRSDKTITYVTDPAKDAAACLALMQGAQLVARAGGDIEEFETAVAGLISRIST